MPTLVIPWVVIQELDSLKVSTVRSYNPRWHTDTFIMYVFVISRKINGNLTRLVVRQRELICWLESPSSF